MPHHRLDHCLQEVLSVIDLAVAARDADEMRRRVLPELAALFHLDSASFFLVEHERFIRPCDLNIDHTRRQEYMSYFYRLSPFRPSRSVIKDSGRQLFRIEDLTPRLSFEESKYYQDHFRFLRVFYETGIYLRSKGRIIGFISLNRSSRQRPFLARELQLAEGLADHLAKVLNLHLARERELQKLEVLQVSGEHLNCGILTLNRCFEPLYQNGRARQLLARLGQEANAGNAGPGLLERIRRGLDGVVGGDTLHLPITLSHQEKYTITASKLGEAGEALQTPAYLVEIRELGSAWNLDAETLRQRYDLSVREVEIVGLIAQGFSNKEMADKLCISPWTVITHVKNIFAKMQVHNRTSAVQKALDLSAV